MPAISDTLVSQANNSGACVIKEIKTPMVIPGALVPRASKSNSRVIEQIPSQPSLLDQISMYNFPSFHEARYSTIHAVKDGL